jgi:hypothetical protein
MYQAHDFNWSSGDLAMRRAVQCAASGQAGLPLVQAGRRAGGRSERDSSVPRKGPFGAAWEDGSERADSRWQWPAGCGQACFST